MLLEFMPDFYTSDLMQVGVQIAYAIFALLGLMFRRRARPSPLSVLIFSGENPCVIELDETRLLSTTQSSTSYASANMIVV